METSPTSTPISTKKSNTLLIVIVSVILLCGCCTISAIGGYFLFKGKADKPVFLDGEDYPPVSQKFFDQMKEKKHKLSGKYSFYTNAIGKPAYSFSILVHEDWKKQERESDEIYFEKNDDEGFVDYGIMFFDVTKKEYKNMTCKEITQSFFDDEGEELLSISSQKITVNGEDWTRLEYTVRQGEYIYIGVDQCLKREEGLIYQYLFVWDEYFDKNESEFQKIMDETYVSEKPIEW